MSDPKSLGEILREALNEISFSGDTRYVLNGIQLKILLSMFEYASKLHNQQEHPDKEMEHDMDLAKDFFNNIYKYQLLGKSSNPFSDDIRDLKNLFASWIGKTEE